MMMIVDLSGADKPFDTVSDELVQIGEEIGVNITLQQEEIFDMMHRL